MGLWGNEDRIGSITIVFLLPVWYLRDNRTVNSVVGSYSRYSFAKEDICFMIPSARAVGHDKT